MTPTGQRHAPPRVQGTAPRLYQQAEAVLADMIRSGSLTPGSHLSETGVAAQLNVSRAPARMALMALAERGLLRKGERRGYVVCTVPPTAGLNGAAHKEGPPPIRARQTWQRIYYEVETEITARIAFGSWRVNEADLSRHYGVSRTVARDVLGRLQQRGVIEKDERARWYAPSLTPERVHELYELRSILEPAALVKAAGRVAPERLAGMLADIDEAIAREAVDGEWLDRLEEALHVELLGHCESRALMEAIRAPQSLLIAHRFLYRWTPRLFRTEPFLPEHREIIGRLIAGDADGAAEALRDHLIVSSERASARVAAVNRDHSAGSLDYLRRLD